MADKSRVSSRRCARRFRAAAPAPASNSRNCHRIGRRRASSSWMTASLGKRHGGHRPRQKLRRTAEGSNDQAISRGLRRGADLRLRAGAGRQGADQDIRRRIRPTTVSSRRGGSTQHGLPGIGGEWLAHSCVDDEAGGRERAQARGRYIGAGFDELLWPLLVRPGDELHVESEILEVRPSKSSANRGLIKVRVTTLNQNGQPCRSSSSI